MREFVLVIKKKQDMQALGRRVVVSIIWFQAEATQESTTTILHSENSLDEDTNYDKFVVKMEAKGVEIRFLVLW